jgi:NADH dehydrogenase
MNIVIGGGFVINLAKELLKPKGDSGNLVDKNNYNFFPPLIYQVATAFWNHPVSVIRSVNFCRKEKPKFRLENS